MYFTKATLLIAMPLLSWYTDLIWGNDAHTRFRDAHCWAHLRPLQGLRKKREREEAIKARIRKATSAKFRRQQQRQQQQAGRGAGAEGGSEEEEDGEEVTKQGQSRICGAVPLEGPAGLAGRGHPRGATTGSRLPPVMSKFSRFL
jgi:hypothetical protein